MPFELPLLILISFLLGVTISYLLLRPQIQMLKELLKSERERSQDLLNRAQSKDLAAYAALSSLNSSEMIPEMYVPMSDEAEASRYGNAFDGEGVPIYDDAEYGYVLDELGLGSAVDERREIPGRES